MSRHIEGVTRLPNEHELHIKNKSLEKKILLTRNQGILYSFLLEENKICQVAREEDDDFPIGTILKGKVSNILKETNGAFIRIDSKGTMAYLSLDEKELKYIRICNREKDGRVLQNDEIIVQVKKQSQKSKPIQVSGILEFVGRYIVLSDNKDAIRRTNASYSSEEDVKNELSTMLVNIDKIDCLGHSRSLYSKLYSPPSFYLQMIYSVPIPNLSDIVTDQKDVIESLNAHNISARLYEDSSLTLSKVYSLNTKIQSYLEKKVYLKSGAYIVIEQTEALISIDVNSGKAQKNTDPDTYSFQINKEAATESIHQLFTRNLSGMILIDFINMKNPEYKSALISHIKSISSNYKGRITFIDFTKLGLAEFTKKKEAKPFSMIMRDWK